MVGLVHLGDCPLITTPTAIKWSISELRFSSSKMLGIWRKAKSGKGVLPPFSR